MTIEHFFVNLGAKTDELAPFHTMTRFIVVLLVAFLLAQNGCAENWMARLDDDALIAELSIPGAHDAATGSGWAGLQALIGNSFARTQDLDLRQLWDVGVRAFDLRPALHKHYLSLNHGMVRTELRFDQVLTMMCGWLSDNPSEFIIIHLLHAADGDKVNDSYERRLVELLNMGEYRPRLAEFRPDLRVGELRGKILILSRNTYNGTLIGGIFRNWTGSSDWRRQTLGRIVGPRGTEAKAYMQDFSSTYVQGTIDIKLAAIRRMLDFSTGHRATSIDEVVWVLNFASAYSKVLKLFRHSISTSNGYRDNATHTHAAFLSYFAAHSTGPTGIILMDYAGVDRSHGYQIDGMKMVHAIIDRNFR